MCPLFLVLYLVSSTCRLALTLSISAHQPFNVLHNRETNRISVLSRKRLWGSVAKKELNDAQYSASVSSPTGPTRCIAGPGSGKTRVLTCRIIHLIKNLGIPPENIIAMTFTNMAGEEMKRRLKGILQPQEVRKITVGTFHAICTKILRSLDLPLLQLLAQSDAIDHEFSIYDDSDCKVIAKSILTEAKKNGLETEVKSSDLLREILNLKNNRAVHGKGPDPISDGMYLATEFIDEYEFKLHSSNAFDFEDLMLLVWKLLRDYPLEAHKLRMQYRHILVDEFQDVNTVQYEIVRLLFTDNVNNLGSHRSEIKRAKKKSNVKQLSSASATEEINDSGSLFVVGDPNQSIYGWRGSKPRFIEDLSHTYPTISTHRLFENYRSTPSITNVANAIIGSESTISMISDNAASAHVNSANLLSSDSPSRTDNNPHNEQLSLSSSLISQKLWTTIIQKSNLEMSSIEATTANFDDIIHDPVWFVKAKTDFDQNNFVVSAIIQLRDAHIEKCSQQVNQKPLDIAILYRTNAQARSLQAALVQANIPFKLAKGRHFFELEEVKCLICYLRLLLNPHDNYAARYIINLPTRGVGKKSQDEFFGWITASNKIYNTTVTNLDKNTEGLHHPPKPSILDHLMHLQSISSSTTGTVYPKAKKNKKATSTKNTSGIAVEEPAVKSQTIPKAYTQTSILAECPLTPRQIKVILPFADIMQQLQNKLASDVRPFSLTSLLQFIDNQIDLDGYYERKYDGDDDEIDRRMKNVLELFELARSWDEIDDSDTSNDDSFISSPLSSLPTRNIEDTINRNNALKDVNNDSNKSAVETSLIESSKDSTINAKYIGTSPLNSNKQVLRDFLDSVGLQTDADKNSKITGNRTVTTLSTNTNITSGTNIQHSQSVIPSVTLMTIHASKGLEFDAVFLTGCEDDYFGPGEEDCRLLFVAATRAKKFLFILWRHKLYTYLGEEIQKPSRLLLPLVKLPSRDIIKYTVS